MEITHVFFDIGGVLGTNGWDREQRARAAERFGLDPEFERRHEEMVGDWESGRMTMDEYLDTTVFYRPRDFSREELTAFLFEQSQPYPESIAVARRLAAAGRVRMMTLNNESAELNAHRIERFGLCEIFTAFLSSCWLGIRKPRRLIFERALGIAQTEPRRALFVDDREQNLAPAAALGFDTVLFTDAPGLARELSRRGLL